MPVILSTATDGVDFVIYEKTPGGLNRALKTITIKGGSNRVDPTTLITPQGVSTNVSDADLEELKKLSLFQHFVDNGFMKICYDGKTDTKDMQKKDKAAQLTEKDFKDKKIKAPTSKK